MRSSRILAVDAGASHVACGEFYLQPAGQLRLERFVQEPLDSDPAHEAAWQEEFAQKLSAICVSRKFAGSAYLSVPGHLALTKFIKTPAIRKSARRKILEFEAAQNIPYPLDEVAWDAVTTGDNAAELEIMLVAAKTEALETLCAAADRANLQIEAIMPAGLACADSFRYNYPEPTVGALILNVGARSTNLLILEGDRSFLRTLALGGNTVTQDLAEELGLDFATAEQLKLQILTGSLASACSPVEEAAVSRATGNFVARLHSEVTRSLASYRRQTPAEVPWTLCLAGDASRPAGVATLWGEKLKLPIIEFNPLRRLELSGEALVQSAHDMPSGLVDLVGLAAQRALSRQEWVSLLPRPRAELRALRQRWPILLATAMLLVLALMGPVWHLGHRLTAVELGIGQLDVELRELRRVERLDAERLRAIDQIKTQIVALQNAQARKASWSGFFASLQQSLSETEDVWLESVSLDREGGADLVETRRPAPANPRTSRVRISARLLDQHNPLAKVSPDSYERAKRLLKSVGSSRYVAAVEAEHFDNGQPGVLRCDFALVFSPEHPL